MTWLRVEEVCQLSLVDPVLVIVRQSQCNVLKAKVGELGPVRISAWRALDLALRVPSFDRPVVLVIGYPSLVQQATKDDLLLTWNWYARASAVASVACLPAIAR